MFADGDKIQKVDIENCDFSNKVFRDACGSATIRDAEARTERMVEEIQQNRDSPANVLLTRVWRFKSMPASACSARRKCTRGTGTSPV